MSCIVLVTVIDSGYCGRIGTLGAVEKCSTFKFDYCKLDLVIGGF